MVTPELIDYIKNQLKLGRSEDVIKSMLKNTGWQDADINEGFKNVLGQNSYSVSSPSMTPNTNRGFQPTFSSSTGQESALPGAGVLLKNSWQIYKSRFWTLAILVAIPILIQLGNSFLGDFLKKEFSEGIYLLIVLPISIIVWIFGLWSALALLFAVKDHNESIGVIESYRRAWGRKILSFLWIGILFGLISLGGFVLLIIPAIIFAVWFSLANFVFAVEDKKGLNALLRSKEYVSGRWWGVAWRLMVLGLINLVIVAVVFGIAIGEDWLSLLMFGPGYQLEHMLSSYLALIIIFIIFTLFFPFVPVYIFSLYTSAKESRSHLIDQPVSAKRGFFIFCAILGALTPIIIILALTLIMPALIK